jgi:hypothetical protein
LRLPAKPESIAGLRLGTSLERIGDESLTPADSVFVPAYILMRCRIFAPDAESVPRNPGRTSMQKLTTVGRNLSEFLQAVRKLQISLGNVENA